jgi:hypothetical protein
MSDNQNQRPVYPKSILDNRSMRLSTEAADQGKWATISLDVNNIAEVVFKVWPNDTEDASRNRGPIEAKFDSVRFNNIMGLIRVAMKMSQEGKDWKDKVERSDYPWLRGEGGRSEKGKEVKPIGAMWVGCTDGRVWISLQVYKRPNIQFFFGKDVYNNLYHGDGQPYADAEISRAFASGWVESLLQHVPVLMKERYDHDKTLPKNKQQGAQGNNTGGGYNNNNRGGNQGGGGGGYSNQQRSESTSSSSKTESYSDDVSDDDLPF